MTETGHNCAPCLALTDGFGHRHFYPSGTAPQNGVEHCTAVVDWYPDSECLLQAGHEGDHQPQVNWSAHIEATPSTIVDGMLTLELRNWHGYGAMTLRSKADAYGLIDWLTGQARETYGDRDAEASDD